MSVGECASESTGSKLMFSLSSVVLTIMPDNHRFSQTGLFGFIFPTIVDKTIDSASRRKPNGHSGHDIDIMENIYITVTYRYDGTMYILDIFGTAKVSWKIDFARVSFARKSSFAFFAGSFI
jgi:hypothetical protein